MFPHPEEPDGLMVAAPVQFDRKLPTLRRVAPRAHSELGERAARGPGRVYFTGGATAVLLGWRETTIDVDLKLDPEAPGVFDALPGLKDELDLNIELAAPDDFLPPLPDWRERSLFIETQGPLGFYHYDLRAQALAKIERGHAQDTLDVRTMLERGLVSGDALREAFARMQPGLPRYPAIDADALGRKLEEWLA